MTPYQISRCRQVFQAMVAITEPRCEAEPRLAARRQARGRAG